MRSPRVLEEIAKKNGLILNPDATFVSKILAGLNKNNNLYGQYFCPCKVKRTLENICPCKDCKSEIRENGHCVCGLFVGVMDEQDAV